MKGDIVKTVAMSRRSGLTHTFDTPVQMRLKSVWGGSC